MDTIGNLPITSKSNRWALTAICLHTSYVFTVLMKESLLKGILAYKAGSVDILSDNGTQ